MLLVMPLEGDGKIEVGFLQQAAFGAKLIGCDRLLLRAKRRIENIDIGRLREYWESLNNGMPPERNLIDPESITELLPYMLLVDFESEPFRVRYRLTGNKG